MNRFKIGEKVKILGGTGGQADKYIGQIGTIEMIDIEPTGQDYYIRFENEDTWWYYDYEIQQTNSYFIREKLGVK